MIILYMILHFSRIILGVFRFCGQGVLSPRKRRKSEIIDEVRSLIIEVRGSQTSSRKEELQHHRKRRKCGKVGRHRGLRSSHTEEGESLTHTGKSKCGTMKKEKSLASQRYHGFGHLRGKKECGITHEKVSLASKKRRESAVVEGGRSLIMEVRGIAKEGESHQREERKGGREEGVITEVRGNLTS